MFSIIVPVLDPFDRLIQDGAFQCTLSKVLAMNGNFEIIIVNNNRMNSCPNLTQYLRSLTDIYPNKVKVVEPNLNLGTARGFNAGLRVAKSESGYLVFMSTDADIVDPLMLEKILRKLDSDPTVGIAHPFSVFEDLDVFNFNSKYSCRAFRSMIIKKPTSNAYDISEGEIKRILDAVSCNKGIRSPLPATPLTFAVYKREMINRIGSFDEGVEFGCYENLDLGIRALHSGYQVVRLNDVFVNHRRLHFRNLMVGGTQESKTLPHSNVIGQAQVWWDKKWGRPYREIYARWRYGKYWFSLMLPYYIIRRKAGSLKKSFSSTLSG